MSSPASSSFTYSEFTPMKSKKNRKNKNIKARPSPLLSLQRNQEELRKESANAAIGSSDAAVGGVGNSNESPHSSGGSWFSQCSQLLSHVWNDHRSRSAEGNTIKKNDSYSQRSSGPSVEEEGTAAATPDAPLVLCLGLGSPSNSPNANVQLAFLLEACKDLDITYERIAVYDPVFSEEDLLLFKELRIQVLSENKKGAYPLSAPTLCFMLHCDMELYEAILKANWDRDRIRNLVLIGNSLTDYLDRNPSRSLQNSVPCLYRIAPHLESRPLSASRQWPTAFNNTCIQYFTPRRESHDDARTGPCVAGNDNGDSDELERAESDDIFASANGEPDEGSKSPAEDRNGPRNDGLGDDGPAPPQCVGPNSIGGRENTTNNGTGGSSAPSPSEDAAAT
ncbi:hypothetical protein DFP72DRAFT_869208 [Ephemerocybe angulata]|uniref:SRR1-like domain-containing protein n=1 Tax=Ephemerocybe angulata TaxID=980116 RepID=A0A8H6IGX7_9AGAR|nr:hypothetical protein DFP72DRAFT_869208 [Tulosesus angulatus]